MKLCTNNREVLNRSFFEGKHLVQFVQFVLDLLHQTKSMFQKH